MPEHDKHDQQTTTGREALDGASAGGPAWEGPVAIVGARLIDGTGGEPIDDAMIVLDGDRIRAVGRQRDVALPADATVIEASGMTVLPGLIDCHVHLAGQWGYDLLRRLMTQPSLSLLYAVPNARATVEAGITTVRDAGGTPAGVKLAIERGLFAGPRMRVAVSFLSQTGGHGDSFMPCCIDLGQSLPSDVPFGVVDGADQMRHKVREILRAGADWIKLCTSGGVLSPADSPESAQFTIEEIAVAVYEAAAQDKRCMAHAQSNRGIKNALEAGITSIEHGIYLDDEAIEMMLRRGVYLVPTLVAPQDVLDLAAAKPGLLPPYAIEKARQVMATHRASFRKAVEAGVKVAMGTDSGVGPHGGNARELALMAEHGMTPMQAIVASSRSAAELLRLDDQLGTLAAGKLADLLVVDGDPLKDVGLLAKPERLALVVKGGAAVRGRLRATKRPVAVSAPQV
ncbi:MAG TPA: amidohydrolase family protein [Ktedonobacterales bacterium]|nr:amidohydrolase family protein [Ktedonobacterales bacterium]